MTREKILKKYKKNKNLQYADLRNAELQDAINIPSIFHSNLNILKSQKGKLIAYKYLDGEKSPYQKHKYKIGKTYNFKNYNSDERILCAEGGNVATLEWCLRDTNCDLSKTYIIVEFDAKNIVSIPFNSDGKFRVNKFRIIRKLTQKELKKAIEPLYPQNK